MINGNATFSCTVNSANNCPSWNTNPNDDNRNALRPASDNPPMDRPPKWTSPPSGTRIPANT